MKMKMLIVKRDEDSPKASKPVSRKLLDLGEPFRQSPLAPRIFQCCPSCRRRSISLIDSERCSHTRVCFEQVYCLSPSVFPLGPVIRSYAALQENSRCGWVREPLDYQPLTMVWASGSTPGVARSRATTEPWLLYAARCRGVTPYCRSGENTLGLVEGFRLDCAASGAPVLEGQRI